MRVPEKMSHRKLVALSVVAVLGVVALALSALYGFIIWEGSSTSADAPALEAAIAQWLLHRTVPGKSRSLKSPIRVEAGGADISAGHELYTKKCEICHAYDGSGKTEIGAGQYPHPPDLRKVGVQKQTDGEVFYHIKNGIRHTGMPGWHMPDQHIWQLVAYVRHLPKIASLSPEEPTVQREVNLASAQYVGSAGCKDCHTDIYERWKTTRMANVVRDPREHPEAIIPDLSKPDPLVNFSKDDIAFVYGSKWKQRYFKKIGDDYFPIPAQWDVTHKIWKPYFVKNGTDWWATLYPPDNFQRPTGPLCDGCHSVNYDVSTKTVMEWNVGCERCHGPGSEHVKHQRRPNIINPAKLNYVQANDVCIQCHSQGQPLKNPIQGKYFDWPVGFHVGMNLSDFWKLEEHKLGETSFTHFADGTAHKNRMQGNDFVQSLMYRRGVTCFSCHDVHGTQNNALLWKPAKAMCLDCHGSNSPNGPHTATVEAHTHHKPDSAGSECIACHMPKIERTIENVNVRAHTFNFITPAKTDAFQIPNACNVCHADKPTRWATAALKTWKDRSPWRIAE